MKATVVDLRYRMNEVIKALDRNENVTVLYHGKVKGVITPVTHKNLNKIQDHPFFGMSDDSGGETVAEEMERLRRPRYDL